MCLMGGDGKEAVCRPKLHCPPQKKKNPIYYKCLVIVVVVGGDGCGGWYGRIRWDGGGNGGEGFHSPH